MADLSSETLYDNLSFFQEDVLGLIDKTQSQISDELMHRELTRCAIKRHFALLKETLSKREDELYRQSEQLHHKLLCDTKHRHKEAGKILNIVRSLHEDIEAEPENPACLKRVQSQYDALLSTFTDIQLTQPVLQFNTNQEDEDTLKCLAFANVVMESESGLPMQNADLLSEKVPMTFNTRTQADIYYDIPTSIIIHEDKFYLTDKANKKIKVFTKDGEFFQEMYLQITSPYCISHASKTIQGDLFAVTAPKEAALLMIVTDSNGFLSLKNKVQTQVGYAGISKGTTGETLVVTLITKSEEPARIDIITYRGGILRSFFLNVYSQPLFQFPRYVEVNLKTIIVSDFRMNTVYFIDGINGAILAEYHGDHDHPLVNPYDLTVDEKGYVYVMDGKTGNIHVLDLKCQLIDVIREFAGELNPRLLCFDKKENKLAVCYGTGTVKMATVSLFMRRPDTGHLMPPTITVPTAPPEPECVPRDQPSGDREESDGGLDLPPSYEAAVSCPSPGF